MKKWLAVFGLVVGGFTCGLCDGVPRYSSVIEEKTIEQTWDDKLNRIIELLGKIEENTRHELPSVQSSTCTINETPPYVTCYDPFMERGPLDPQ